MDSILKQGKQRLGNGATQGIIADPGEHDLTEVPYQGVALAESETIADDKPQDGGQAGNGEALQQYS